MKDLLIVVDMINAFCHTKGALAKSIVNGEFYGVDVIPNVKGLVDIYRHNQDPIIWLYDNHAPDDKEFDRFPPHAVKDTWETGIVDQLDPQAALASPFELLIPKTRYSGFYGTDLEYQLLRLAPKKVTVCGVCTSICVMDTVGGLANRDYDVVVYKNSVADFDPAGHDAALARMEGLYGAKII
jgi:nicotinamidase/pyrazinamidase